MLNALNLNMLLIQGIGAIAYTMLALSYSRKEKGQILFMQIIAYIFFSIHFYFLNGITGVICNIIGLVALITIYLFDKYNVNYKIQISIIFIIILLIVNIITFQNIYSIFPMIASIIVIISFLDNNENTIRIIGTLSATCWLLYAIVYKSYITIAFEGFVIINTITSFIKNLPNKNNKNIKT